MSGEGEGKAHLCALEHIEVTVRVAALIKVVVVVVLLLLCLLLFHLLLLPSSPWSLGGGNSLFS